jgi:serine/threonine protein kinase/tetratricopeptide (TPR) repeat protein
MSAQCSIGHYRITSKLGEGGMGEVWLATDTKLGREVAIKVLPASLAQDASRLARFKREAQFLASLNHPNIAAIYGLEEQAIVMELVPGHTLAERLAGGELQIEEALKIGSQIVEALAAAHRKGITHRDIKPANVKVTPEGRVKVLDFGLAKLAHEPELECRTEAVTVTAITNAEVIVGTPAYMSPEQIRNEPVDQRADIWAFGCLLWELLQGRAPFRGEGFAETVASILRSEPAWHTLPKWIPVQVRDLMRRCLQKDVRRRLQDISEARTEIESAQRAPVIAAPPEPNPAIESLAVLPFANAGGDPEMEYLSDGLTESIIFGLTQLPRIRVMSRNAVFRYKGRNEEAQEIGKALGVNAVLTGRVQQRGGTLLVSAGLMDVNHGWQRWGGQFKKNAEDIYTLEEEIAKEISDNLRLTLTPESEKQLSKRYSENVEAYHLYLKGRFYWGKRTEEGLFKGIQHFRQAIELDPTYALAYAGLAEGYVPLAHYCHLAPNDACPKARAAAKAALEIDPTLAEARAVLGCVMSLYDWDLQGAEKELREAIALNPGYPRARQILAETLMMGGRFEEAKAEARRALDLDPLALSLNAFMAMTHYFAREYGRAIEAGLRTVEMDPHFFPGYFYLGLAYQMAGDFAAACEALQKAKELSDNSTLMTASLGGVFAACGKQTEARNIVDILDQTRPRKYVSQVFVAAILAGLGEIGRALACLETAYQDRCIWLPGCLKGDGRLDPLRNQPRLQDLIHRINLQHHKGDRQ